MRMGNDRLLNGLTFWLGVGFIVGCIAVALQGCGGGGPLPPVCEEGVVSEAAYVVGGEPSEDRRSTVLVEGRSGFCSGTVVGPRTVLTAAHCHSMDRILIQVNGLTTFTVVEDVVHPDYDFPKHDLRLLTADRDLPEPYATLGSFPECTTLIVQGYGFDSPRVLSERVVDDLGRRNGIIYTTTGSCNGDSGGPLWATDGTTTTQVGVTSFGFGAPRFCNLDAGFVDLDDPTNLDWIQENIR